jgi:hypothetical protein
VLCFISHARLRVRRAPGIPHALVFLGERFKHGSGASRREIADSHLVVIARSEATKQSSLLFRGANYGLLRFARNDGLKTELSWLFEN